MTWIEIVLLWIVLSVALPVLFGLRYTQLKEYRERLRNSRTRFHRFHASRRQQRVASWPRLVARS
jgi:hypothetical protein